MSHVERLIAVALIFAPAAVMAADAAADREEMQKALNKEVMATPFNAGDVDKASHFAEEAKRLNVVPVAQPPSYWLPGWTCANMTTYEGYNYLAYRNCIYYHYYYGRYWR